MKFEEKIRKTLQATTGNICAIIKEGINHNTTGGISVASDRQYYLNAMQGKSGIELIFNSRATNKALLMFYSTVYYEGEIIGSLIGAYEGTNQLDKLLTMEVFGYIAEAYLCNANGEYKFHRYRISCISCSYSAYTSGIYLLYLNQI